MHSTWRVVELVHPLTKEGSHKKEVQINPGYRHNTSH